MKKFTLFIVMFFSVYMNAQETKTLQNSLVKAKQEHKKVLLYFSGSDWCAPCIKFKKTFIQNETFQSFASENLIVVNADFPRLKKNALSAEQTTENEKLADKYNANGIFPLILVLDENGKILKKWEKLPEETIDTFLAQLK